MRAPATLAAATGPLLVRGGLGTPVHTPTLWQLAGPVWVQRGSLVDFRPRPDLQYTPLSWQPRCHWVLWPSLVAFGAD